MAGSNRVKKLTKRTRQFSVLLNAEDHEVLEGMGESTGHSIGHLIRECASNVALGKTYSKGVQDVLDLVSSSPLIKGDDLPDGQTYSEYVSDRFRAILEK
tara:strand:+ start:176 stop:475 length:300 start_codon:yes stop_codon:yes gene_type:complete